MIYFIRHAQTVYNAAQAAIEEKLGADYRKSQQYLNEKFDRKYLDVDITELGIKQCQESKLEMKDIDLDLIIVSPMRRALQTCKLTFQDHKSKAPVVVDPAFRQLLCSSNDIGSRTEENMEEFKEYDFSAHKDTDAWWLNNLNDKEYKESLLKKLNQSQVKPRKQAAIQVTLDFMKEHFQTRMQDVENDRKYMQKVLPDIQGQIEILKQKLKTHKSIAVVSHSRNIQTYAGYKIKNCQIFPFSKEQLENMVIQ